MVHTYIDAAAAAASAAVADDTWMMMMMMVFFLYTHYVLSFSLGSFSTRCNDDGDDDE